VGVGGQRHSPAALTPGNGPGTHSIRGWVGLRGRSGTNPRNQPTFQVSAAKYLITALFWLITPRVLIIPYRRFGTAVPKIIIFIWNRPLFTERVQYVPTGLKPSLRMFPSALPLTFTPSRILATAWQVVVVVLLRGIPMFPGPASWIIDGHYAKTLRNETF